MEICRDRKVYGPIRQDIAAVVIVNIVLGCAGQQSGVLLLILLRCNARICSLSPASVGSLVESIFPRHLASHRTGCSSSS